ncbi:calmodulin-regulated spectrin-associated protein patronin isoform X1 [Dermacentor variabilis]|uniref:calmodulin-regulated spectrin-associated protein patronin isoform X1 n=1 Tax=Dermacentor variabilis TaxID=34621 RepID=UPI003F5B3028
MDTMDEDYDLDGVELTPIEEYDFAKAKQRASVLWLVSKAHQNRVPPELREVFYRDQAEQDRLRPQLVQALASGELYCLALANIYADPNYHSLSHQGVVQALQRKGVEVEPPADHTPLTETVLAQTAPLRMSAHMAVINGIMELYIKEVLIPIKVFEVVRRFSAVGYPEEVPVDAEDAALLWLNKCSVKMRHRIEDELGPGQPPVGGPPVLQDLADLNDGCALAALLSFYCPQHLPWHDLCLPGDSLADSLYNLQLSQRFCDAHLPHDVFFLTVEDVLFVHPSIRQNLLALLADLMFVFEIRPAKCVRRPGLRYDPPSAENSLQAARHRGESLRKARALQNSCSHIPDLCPADDHNQTKHNGAWPEGVRRLSQGAKPSTRVSRSSVREDEDSDQLSSSPRCRSDEDDAFLTGRRPSSSLRRHSTEAMDPLLPARLREPKERNNCDVAKYLERGEDTSLGSSPTPQSPARSLHEAMLRAREAEEHGSPAHRASSISGNLSLRRSTSRSELGSPLHRSGSRSTLVGSDHASPLHRSASKSDVGSPLRRNSSRSDLFQPTTLSRSTSQTDIYGGSPIRRTGRLAMETEAKKPSTLETYYDQLGGGLQKQAGYPLRRESSLSHMYNFSGEKAALEMTDPFETDMFAEHRERTKKAAQVMSFAQLSKMKDTTDSGKAPSSINIVYMQQDGSGNRLPPEKRKTTPTDGVSKSSSSTTTWQQQAADSEENRTAEDSSSPLAAQLNNVRLKLEERRRKIEQEKRRMEDRVKKQRQKVSKAAFLQAVARGDSKVSEGGSIHESSGETLLDETSADSVDSEHSQQKWLHQNGSPQPVQESPQSDDVDLEDSTTTIEQLSTELTVLQSDISRITKQQQAIQNLLHGPQAVPLQPQPQEQFFLHSGNDSGQPQSLPTFAHATPQPYLTEVVRPPLFQQQQLQHQQHQQQQQLQHQQHQQQQQLQQQQLQQQQLQQQQQQQQSHQRRQWEYPMAPILPPQQPRRGQWGPPVVTLAEQPMRWGAPAAALVDPGYVVYPSGQNEFAYQPPFYQNGTAATMQQVGYASFTMPSQQQPQQPVQQQLPQQPQQQQQQHPLPPPFQALCTVSTEQVTAAAPTQSESQRPSRTPPPPAVEEQLSERLENLSMGSLASQPRSVEFGKTYRVSKGQQPVRNQAKPSDDGSEVGFFISFDDQQPKKPKPKLRPRIAKPEENARPEELGLSNGTLTAASTESTKGSENSSNSAPSENQGPPSGSLGVGFVIGADLVNPDPEAENEMQRRKEMMMLVSLRRREEQEAARLAKEQRNAVKRMQEQLRREEQARKREEDRQRRQMILEQYRQRKAQEEAEKDAAVHGGSNMSLRGGEGGATLTRSSAKPRSSSRPRPKSMHLGPCSLQRGSHTSLDECGRQRAASPPPSGTEWRASASDGASDTASTHSLMLLPSSSEYVGPKLFVKPTAKSNRSIIINAINTVLAGAVNSETKRKVLEEINISESKHFLILFRDSGCQFRGLYSYYPEREEVLRLHGTGPRSVLPSMMDMFFKYNSGAKSFTQIHTKHLTVTIDAFTIHNHLWTVKKTCVPQRRDL